MGPTITAPAASPAFLAVAAPADASAQQANGAAVSSSPFAALLVSLTSAVATSAGAKGMQTNTLPGTVVLPDADAELESDTAGAESALFAASLLAAPVLPLEVQSNVQAGDSTTEPGTVLAPVTSASESHAFAAPSAAGADAFAASADAILPSLPELTKDEQPTGKLDISGMEAVEPKVVDLESLVAAKATREAPVVDGEPVVAAEMAPRLERLTETNVRSFSLPQTAADLGFAEAPVASAPGVELPIDSKPTGKPQVEPPADALPTAPVEPPGTNTPPTGPPPTEPPEASLTSNGVVRIDGNANQETSAPAAPAANLPKESVPATVIQPTAQPAVTQVAAVASVQAGPAIEKPAGVTATRSNERKSSAAGAELLAGTSDAETSDDSVAGAGSVASLSEVFVTPAAATSSAVTVTAAPASDAGASDATPAISVAAAGDAGAATSGAAAPGATPVRVDAPAAPAQADAPASPRAAFPEPAQQVAAAILEQVNAGGGDARLHLQPRELGDVVIHIRTRGEHVEVNVQAERAEAVAMLRDSVNELSGLLGERGLNLADLNVGLGMQQQSRGWEPSALPNNSRRSNGEFAQLLGDEQPSAAGTHRRLQAAYNPDGKHLYRI